MRSRVQLHALCLALVAAAGVSRSAPDPAEQVFEAAESRVYQVRVVDRVSGNQATIGSGFHAGGQGLVVTNFHVVAKAVFEPERYRIEYVDSAKDTGELELRSVGVVHDLAVLRADGLDSEPLTLRTEDLPQGARIFSMGNPRDLGMTVKSGGYNGHMEGSLYERILFSGSLNPGMSGGPALDADSRVVGINVATGGDDLSFLVPSARLGSLLAAAEKPKKPSGLQQRIEDQLLANQARYMDRLLNSDWQRRGFGPVRLPGEIADFVQCWGETTDDENQPYRISQSQCGTKDRVYLSPGFDTSQIRYRYRLITSDKLNPFRFYNLYSSQYASTQGFRGPSKSDVTEFECRSRFYEVVGRTWKGAFCARRYKRFPRVHDAFLSAALMTETNRGVIVQVSLTGVSRNNAKRFAAKFLDAVEWMN
jgi:hypothetical protein